MNDSAVKEAMAAMGWNGNAEIPVANDANRELLNEVENLVREKEDLQTLYSETVQRHDKLKQHSKNAETAINNKLKLLLAHQSDLRTESHLFQVVHREHEKLKELTKDIDKEIQSAQKLLDTVGQEVCKRKDGIDKKTDRIQWAKNALIEWREAMDDGNRGYQLIEKYFKDDQQKAREQNQRRQMLTDQIEKCRKELVELLNEKMCLEQNLDSIAKLYRMAHVERRQMVDTWKAAVHQMTQREHEIYTGELHLRELQKEYKTINNERLQKDAQLTAIIENNRAVEESIDELNTDTSHLKSQMTQLSEMIVLKGNEVDILQKELVNLSNRVAQQRADNRRNMKMKSDKDEELEKFAEVLDNLNGRLVSMQDKQMSAQQRLEILEEMNDQEDKSQKSIIKETQRINTLVYRAQEQFVILKDEMKVLDRTNENIRVTIVAIERNMLKTGKDLQRQTEVHYDLAFKCLETERSIIREQGGVLDPEEEAKTNAQLAQLEELYASTQKRLQATEIQNQKLDDNMRALTAVYTNDNKTLEVLQYRVKEAILYCKGGVVRLKSEQTAIQDLIVEMNIQKMRANQFEIEISKCANTSYNLGKHRAHLVRTMKDRIVEINSQMDLLVMKRKHLNEEKSTLRADIGERDKHIEAKRTRFELSTRVLGTNEDGTLVTATQLRVEMAQEKQMLLEEGSVLNHQVLKAEDEVKAMENTLMLLNNSNDGYRLRSQGIEEATACEVIKMEQNYQKGLEKLKEIKYKVFEIEAMKDRQLTLRDELINALTAKRERSAKDKAKLDKLVLELDDQKQKLDRAERGLRMAIKDAKLRGIPDDIIELMNRELDLRELEHKNLTALNQLTDMAQNEPQLLKKIVDKGFELPHTLRKTQSLISWRSQMSISSTSSIGGVSDKYSTILPTSSISEEGSRSTIATTATYNTVSTISIEFP